jgi:hypothetical protein
MDETKDEIAKRKKIRRTLLLKINDELKEISQSKPTLLINSKTIQEIEKVYNKNNILLSEKGTIYSNYVKTGIKIYPPIIKPLNKFKSVEKKNEKSKIKLEIIGLSYDEEILSPILNFFPIKKNLYYKQLATLDKRYTKNNWSIQKFIDNNLNSDENSLTKDNQLNKSTKLENNNLLKLIAKILSLKDNENMEKIIKRNIKKLRKYCYRFRNKKRKNKRYKSQDSKIKINNSINNINSNNNSNSNNLHTSSRKINSRNNEKEKEYRNSHFKVVHKASSKKPKNYLSLKTNNKRSSIKLKTLNEDESKKLIIKLHKMKIKPIKIENDNMNNNIKTINYNNTNESDEPAPNICEIKKELMKSSINETSMKLLDMPNCFTNIDKVKIKNSKKANKKKIIIKKASLFQTKEIEKLKMALKKDKKDKIELHDNLLVFKSNKKLKKLETSKHENKNRNRSFAHKLTKIKKPNISSKKSKIKLIDSPVRKIDYYSNCNTYYYTNVFNLTQSTDDKNNKGNRNKSKNEI